MADGPLTPWYWRIGGRSGPLPIPPRRPQIQLMDVDNRDRIVGRLPGMDGLGVRGLLWRGPTKQPQLMDIHVPQALNDHGDVTGPAFTTGRMHQAWVSHLRSDRLHTLPYPPGPPDGGNTEGNAVIRGVTAFAPHGGVTVGGTQVASGMTRAIIWTCAHRQ